MGAGGDAGREQVLGLECGHLVRRFDALLHPLVLDDLQALTQAAAQGGFELRIASGHRSFGRQLEIWNAKASGRRPVLDDSGAPLDLAPLSDEQRLHAICRFSAMPGASRHHWGSDMDIYDARACPPGYRLQLTAAEAHGMFGEFHSWLDTALPRFGFFRPYRGQRADGIAAEPWHISHAATAAGFARILDADMLAAQWHKCDIQLRDCLLALLPQLYERYVVVQ